MGIRRKQAPADRWTAPIGAGVVAGLLGTAAMTVSSTVEAKLSGRGSSTTPSDAAGRVAGVEPRDESGEQRFNSLVHWAYGTGWGVFRGLLDMARVRGPAASLAHFAAVWAAEQAVLPALRVGSPTPAYGAKATATDVLHHAVYATATGLVYDRLRRG
ncbi:hypothetical protein [Qaidamihabitans albus]|uniref:hypothetical protein n=1 Tax=Qaidamihabitans albus TaxID=2795733 RepID=UPI0018F255AD|nr:hypothetical protein [Qaidamihabitans albus]